MRRQQPIESDFEISVSTDTVAALFLPSRSLHTFRRILSERDVADFGPVSPDPVVRHGSRSSGTGKYDATEVLVMAFRLATAVVHRSMTSDASGS
jgi:hypothetical protein